MADVSRITGPTGPREPNKDKQAADAAKFKELMRIQKVGEVDEEQKKKRKRQDEAEAESKADTEETIGAQAGQKPPLEGTPPQKSLKIEGPSAQPPSAPTKATPPPEEPEPHYMEEESFMSTLPSVDLRTDREKGEQEQKPQEAERKRRPQENKVEGAKAKAISEYKEAELRAAEKAAQKKKKEEELTSDQVAAQAPAAPLQAGKKGDKEKKIEETQAAGPVTSSGAPLTGTPQTPTAPAPYAQLHPMVLDLFERMVGVMTVMSTAGITETTVTLSSPQYANSVFFGAQIIVKEYSTAPKAFNIQIITNPQAASLVQANVDDLMAAFRTGKYNFKVNRLEAGISAEKPLFRRKEGIGRDKEEEKK